MHRSLVRFSNNLKFLTASYHIRNMSSSKRKFSSISSSSNIKFLKQEEAKRLDSELMGDEYAFTDSQLIELAGCSCAHAVVEEANSGQGKSVLVVCGPGNNGNDGLVCARHLFHFGFNVSVVFPKRKGDYSLRLLKQCDVLGIDTLANLPGDLHFDFIVDAMFGFSFKGELREPFKTIISELNKTSSVVVAVDIPSGWEVEKGNVSGAGMRCDALVSLTAPKLCAKSLPESSRHYLGGRFVPPSLAAKYNLNLPTYESTSILLRLQ